MTAAFVADLKGAEPRLTFGCLQELTVNCTCAGQEQWVKSLFEFWYKLPAVLYDILTLLKVFLCPLLCILHVDFRCFESVYS